MRYSTPSNSRKGRWKANTIPAKVSPHPRSGSALRKVIPPPGTEDITHPIRGAGYKVREFAFSELSRLQERPSELRSDGPAGKRVRSLNRPKLAAPETHCHSMARADGG